MRMIGAVALLAAAIMTAPIGEPPIARSHARQHLNSPRSSTQMHMARTLLPPILLPHRYFRAHCLVLRDRELTVST